MSSSETLCKVYYRPKLGKDGRLVIPAPYRKALGIEPGDNVMLVLGDGELRMMSTSGAVKRAQSLVRQYVGAGRRLSEELIRERRSR